MIKPAITAHEQDQVASTVEVEASSGNVFADLGLPNPEERLLKARLSILINRVIASRGLTQSQAAALLGTDQAKVSLISNGRLAGFSVERLLRFLMALDQDVTISVSPKPLDRPSRVEVNGLDAVESPVQMPSEPARPGSPSATPLAGRCQSTRW
jgi:predicted XRE-type DNA-binding protein